MPGPLDYLKSLFQSNPSTGQGEDINLPSDYWQGPKQMQQPADPLGALKGAGTIGASKVGERYAEPENPSTLDMIRQFTGGAQRPRSVAAADPYGIQAWMKDAGPVPGMMMGSTEEADGPVKKAFAGLKGMYSRVDRAAEALPEALHPVKAESIFKNNAAKEEIDYRGLGDFLKGNQAPKVTKAAIQEHLAANPMPEIGVKDLGEKGWSGERSRRLDELEQLGHRRTEIQDGEFQDLIDQENAHSTTGRPLPTKYERSSLNVPGGENYRERLLTLPNKANVPSPLTLEQSDNLHLMTQADRDALLDAHTWSPDQQQATYQSGHWDEPNVLAHSRFDERVLNQQTAPKWRVEPNTDTSAPTHASEYPWRVVNAQTGDPQFWAPNEEEAHNWIQRDPFNGDEPRSADFNATPVGGNRGRFIQEVQSDWHQAGKEHGYGDGPRQARLAELQNNADQANTHLNDLLANLGQKYRVQPNTLLDQIHADTIPTSVDRMPLHLLDDQDMQKLLATHSSPDPQTARAALYPEFKQKYYPYALNDEERHLLQQAHYQRQATRRDLGDYKANVPPGVPDAPFKDSWPDLVLKNHVLDVAERPDLNWLGFTTGQTQSDRYGMANHANELHYSWDPHAQTWDISTENGHRTGDVPDATLHEAVGLDAADALRAHRDRLMEGMAPFEPDERAAGILQTNTIVNDKSAKGQKFFYDQKLPSALGKILKPFGGKVELGEIPGPTPKMSIYSKQLPGDQWVGRLTANGEDVAHTWPPLPYGGRPEDVLQARQQSDALKQAVAQNPSFSKGIPAWIAHLPPEMKKAILEKGLPLLTLLGMSQLNGPQEPPRDALDALKQQGRQ